MSRWKMHSKPKIIVVKLKDILFYATVAILIVIVLLLFYILFQPEAAPTDSTITVYQSIPIENVAQDYIL